MSDHPQTRTRAEDTGGADRLSVALVAIADAQDRDRISIGDLLEALRHRALAALMFIFAVPTALPMPPGVSAVLGAPLIFLTVQLTLGMRPWLPRFITRRSLSRVDFSRVVAVAVPWLARAESVMRPRLTLLAMPPAVRLVGLVTLCMSIVLFLPIPLGNMLPSIAICIIALGVLERDGVWILLGLVLAAASLVIVWGVLWALLAAGLFVLSRFLGVG